MLELAQVDLQDLVGALEDHTDLHSWWLDPQSGAVELWSEELVDAEDVDPWERGWLAIEPIGSSEGYGDMVDFVDAVSEPRARDLLSRAIEGRGAFRRFKDTISEFPDLRELWFEFHRIRMERRAIEWLRDESLISHAEAERAIAQRADPQPRSTPHPHAVARAVADELGRLYGKRLRDVRIYGSWARGDAHPESDIDLLVVLDHVESRWSERRRIEDVLWKHSFANDVVVSAHPVSADELDTPGSPFLERIRAEATALS